MRLRVVAELIAETNNHHPDDCENYELKETQQ